jgi:hypothetical protein
VELLIANWIRARITVANHRNLVVNVQMLSASHLSFTSHTTTVTGHDVISIGIARVLAITEKVLASRSTRSMIVNSNRSSLLVNTLNIRPHAIVVNLWANGCAVLVIFLTGNIHTSLRTTLCEKLLLGVIMEEDIKVTLDLLGGRPVDLAVLLKALLLVHMFFIFSPALLFALLKVDRADGKLASILLTETLLKLLLVVVARQVDREEGVVVGLALSPELNPRSVGRLVPDDFTRQPPSKLANAVASVGLAVSH